MDAYALSGLLGTVFSIATFFIPDNWKSRKLTLALFVFTIVILCSIITYQNTQLYRIKKVSQAAEELLKLREISDDAGFIQASLAFLEQNKDKYPNAFSRATRMYEMRNYNHTDYSVLSSEMTGIIEGISILNQNIPD